MNNPGPGCATVCVTDPCVKAVILPLDAVFDLAGVPLALSPHRDRDIEDQREIGVSPPVATRRAASTSTRDNPRPAT